MIAESLRTIRSFFGRVPRGVRWGLEGLLAALVVAVVVAVVLTSRPSFLGGYHSYERRYTAMQTSLHSGLACGDCHVDSRGTVVREAALVGDFYRGLVSKPDAPVFVKLQPPTRAACLSCHREDWSDNATRTARIPHPAHLRVAEETRNCVDCHKWTAHEEAYLERHKEMPFSTVCASFGCHVGTKTAKECASCHHELAGDAGGWKLVHYKTVQASGPNGCLETCHDADQCRMCHTTGKRPDFSAGALSSGVKAIERQHVKPDWLEKHGGMALSNDAVCFDCHVSPAECDDCHAQRPAFHGPKSTWLSRHKTFAKNERRCLTCHEKKWCDDCHAQFKEMR